MTVSKSHAADQWGTTVAKACFSDSTLLTPVESRASFKSSPEALLPGQRVRAIKAGVVPYPGTTRHTGRVGQPLPQALGASRRLSRIACFIAAFLLGSVLGCILIGCGHGPVLITGSTGTPQEDYVLDETKRFAGMLGVAVGGKLTDNEHPVPAGQAGCPKDHAGPCLASGWYLPGMAWYYRPHIVTYEMKLISDVAAHEVCHAISPGHDALHVACCRSVGATPTYSLTPSGAVFKDNVVH